MHKEQIEKIRQGNLEELDKVYLEVKPKFFSYASNAFTDIVTEEVEDIYQDTIIDFYNNIKRGLLTEITSSLSAYIIQIGKMKLIKLSDKKKARQTTTINSIDDLISSQDYDHKIDDIVKFIFANTSESCKQILNLFYFNKKSMDDIAKELGYKNADTVKSKKNRCISKISEQITKMQFGDE